MGKFNSQRFFAPIALAGLLTAGCKPADPSPPTSPTPPPASVSPAQLPPAPAHTKAPEGFSIPRAADKKVTTLVAPRGGTNAVLTVYGQVHRVPGDCAANVDATIAYSQAGILRDLLSANYKRVLIEGETSTARSEDKLTRIGAEFVRQVFPQGEVPQELSELQFRFFTEKWGMGAGNAYVAMRDNVTLIGAETREGNSAAIQSLNEHQGVVGRPEVIFSVREKIAMGNAKAILLENKPVALIYGADHDFSSQTNELLSFGFGMTSVSFPYLKLQDNPVDQKFPLSPSDQLNLIEDHGVLSLPQFAQLTGVAKQLGFSKLSVTTFEFPTAESLYSAVSQTLRGRAFDVAMNGLLTEAYKRKQGPFKIYTSDPLVHQRWSKLNIEGSVAGYALMVERSPEFISHVVSTAQQIPVEAFGELSDEKTQLEALPKLHRIKITSPRAMSELNAEPVVIKLMQYCVVIKSSAALKLYYSPSTGQEEIRDILLSQAVTQTVKGKINQMFASKVGIFAQVDGASTKP